MCTTLYTLDGATTLHATSFNPVVWKIVNTERYYIFVLSKSTKYLMNSV